MAKSTPDFGTLLAAGMLGFGVGMLAASAKRTSNEERRRQFFDALAANLLSHDVRLLGASLGRGRHNEPFWMVTVQSPHGAVWTPRVLLDQGVGPYSTVAIGNIVDAVGTTGQTATGVA